MGSPKRGKGYPRRGGIHGAQVGLPMAKQTMPLGTAEDQQDLGFDLSVAGVSSGAFWPLPPGREAGSILVTSQLARNQANALMLGMISAEQNAVFSAKRCKCSSF